MIGRQPPTAAAVASLVTADHQLYQDPSAGLLKEKIEMSVKDSRGLPVIAFVLCIGETASELFLGLRRHR